MFFLLFFSQLLPTVQENTLSGQKSTVNQQQALQSEEKDSDGNSGKNNKTRCLQISPKRKEEKIFTVDVEIQQKKNGETFESPRGQTVRVSNSETLVSCFNHDTKD